MISSTSLSAFSTPGGVGATRPTQRPQQTHELREARLRPKQPMPLQAQPDKPGAPRPEQPLPRGSLLDLSV